MTKVNLTKRIDGDRYCPVVVAANGRIKPDYVIVNGVAEHHPEGAYYIDWTDGHNKRRRLSAGKSAASALAQKLRKEAELEAQAHGIQLVVEGKARSVEEAAGAYLEEIRLAKKHKTFLAYSTAVEYFLESCKKAHLEEIERADLLRFAAFLRDGKGQSPRSVRNKFENVMTFLKAQGITGIIRKGDRPTYVLSEPEVYEKEDLDAFFIECSPQERLWFRFFLMTGMREQEVIYTMQRNLHVSSYTVTMTWKPEFNWYPKGYKEREIPIPDGLVTDLVAARPEGWHGRDLLFPTGTGGPMLHFLESCKDIADRAGLDPADWWLHKFRATFATWHLQNGVDLRTVQKWMGHVDLESTMRYLKPARSEQVRDRVNNTFA